MSIRIAIQRCSIAALCLLTEALCVLTLGAAPAEASLRSDPGGTEIQEAGHQLDIEISGTIARVTARWSIVNRGRKTVTGLYRFQLPMEATIVALEVTPPDGKSNVVEVVDVKTTLGITASGRAMARRDANPDIALLRMVARSTLTEHATYELRLHPIRAGKATQVSMTWLSPMRHGGQALTLRIPRRDDPGGNLVRPQVRIRLRPGSGISTYRQLFASGRLLASVPGRRAHTTVAPTDRDLVVQVTPTRSAKARQQPQLLFSTVPIDHNFGAVAVQVWAPPTQGRADLDYERAVIVVDRSVSMAAGGHAAAATLTRALLSSLPGSTRVELVLFDRKAHQLLGRLTPNSGAIQQQITAALSAPPLPTNGSDLGAALSLVNSAVERDTRKHGASRTLVAVISDGLAPLHLDGARAIDLVGDDVITNGQVFAVTLVPDTAPTPDSSDGPLATLAARTGGTVLTIRHGDAAHRAAGLADDFIRPRPLDLLRVEAGKTTLHVTLPDKLWPERGVLAVGFYRGPRPNRVYLRGRRYGARHGKKFRVAGQSDRELAKAAVALALNRIDVSRISGGNDLLAAARKAHVVTSQAAMVAVDSTDAYARDRLAMVRKWGGRVYSRVPAAHELDRRRPLPSFESKEDTVAQFAIHQRRPTGQLDKAIIERLIDRHVKPKARSCYARALRKDPKLRGGLVLYLELSRGEVQWSEVRRSTFPAASVEACVARAGYSIHVPRVALGDDVDAIDVVRYPLNFRQSANKGKVTGGAPPPIAVDPSKPL